MVIGPVIVQRSGENRKSHESCNPLNFMHSVKETLFSLMPYESIIRFVLAVAVAWPEGTLGVREIYAIMLSVSVPDCLCYFVRKLDSLGWSRLEAQLFICSPSIVSSQINGSHTLIVSEQSCSVHQPTLRPANVENV